MTEPSTPVTDDAHATTRELLARAAADYRNTRQAANQRQQQGGTGVRQGVLPGSVRR